MAGCLGCGNWIEPEGDQWTPICDTCRRQLNIGKAVEEMPEGSSLHFGITLWKYSDDKSGRVNVAASPLEALTGAKK